MNWLKHSQTAITSPYICSPRYLTIQESTHTAADANTKVFCKTCSMLRAAELMWFQSECGPVRPWAGVSEVQCFHAWMCLESSVFRDWCVCSPVCMWTHLSPDQCVHWQVKFQSAVYLNWDWNVSNTGIRVMGLVRCRVWEDMEVRRIGEYRYLARDMWGVRLIRPGKPHDASFEPYYLLVFVSFVSF